MVDKDSKSALARDIRTTGTQTISKLSLEAPGRSYDTKLDITMPDNESLSFRQWHERMQKNHDITHEGLVGAPKFSIYNWCNCLCSPCRYVDSVDFNAKICFVCCKFRTFKAWTTGFIIAGLVYIILFVLLGNDVLPGGTTFFLLVMFLLAFLLGNVFITLGLPSTVGQILVGIVCANLPYQCDEDKLMKVMDYSEKLAIVIILIRAALHLDFAQIHGHIRLIIRFSIVPYSAEFLLIFLCGRYLMEMPWVWSALQGFIVTPVSLATVVTILEKNKKVAFGENSQMPTLMIAASSVQAIISIYAYSMLLAIIFSKGVPWVSSWWSLLIALILQVTGGILIGVILGCIVGMFPDRRSTLAPHCRIIVTGCGTIALILGFHKLGMSGVGVLSSLTMVFIASNIWEELGWHESSNPVLYFYSILYFLIQPVAVSLVGLSMSFKRIKWSTLGKSFALILIGITGRGLTCLAVAKNKNVRTTWSERLFICICFMPKGAVEALLGSSLSRIVRDNYDYVTDTSYTLQALLDITLNIMHTTILGILVTSPLASILAALLTPHLFRNNL